MGRPTAMRVAYTAVIGHVPRLVSTPTNCIAASGCPCGRCYIRSLGACMGAGWVVCESLTLGTGRLCCGAPISRRSEHGPKISLASFCAVSHACAVCSLLLHLVGSFLVRDFVLVYGSYYACNVAYSVGDYSYRVGSAIGARSRASYFGQGSSEIGCRYRYGRAGA